MIEIFRLYAGKPDHDTGVKAIVVSMPINTPAGETNVCVPGVMKSNDKITLASTSFRYPLHIAASLAEKMAAEQNKIETVKLQSWIESVLR
jgi:hypothetical protein